MCNILLIHFKYIMKKTYVGSTKLNLNFKMFRIKYENSYEADRIQK